MLEALNPITLTQNLIRCPSVTPVDAGALGVLVKALEPLGFDCHLLTYEEKGEESVPNLFAIRKGEGRHLCFAGHTDVVPVGDASAWKHNPFGAVIEGGYLYGRGAEDMKGAIACMVAAVAAYQGKGTISFLITGDEEAVAVNGTVKVLPWMKAKGYVPDACIVGEPTNPDALGQTIKIGRRGTLTTKLTVHGTQGHVAYPDKADNPVPKLVRILHALTSRKLDAGNAHFSPSNLEVTTVDVGNTADNVIPAKAFAQFNIRFNTEQNAKDLKAWIESVARQEAEKIDLHFRHSGDAFLTPPGALSDTLSAVVKEVTGLTPQLNTLGGTSDARFIKDYCPVVEFGTTGLTPHKVNERVAVKDLELLTQVYLRFMERYFKE
ncbi:MAG: succinyl-diaminopimelate desuccinylase [Alphaproteobacteria bacterium]|nr:succinyl-diaminopimelate desuccinylase [Alphaproteobacteria bacterium]